MHIEHEEETMQFAKMRCASCRFIDSCPKLTRLFMNYCGSRLEQVRTNIRAAEADCLARRSYVTRHFPRTHATTLRTRP